MLDKTYLYCGPLSAVSLPGGRDVQLSPGQHMTLPDDNDYVRTLVARKYLVPVAAPESKIVAPGPVAENKPASVSASSSSATESESKTTPVATASNTMGDADAR